MTHTPHKPTKRKPLKDAKASEAQARVPQSRVSKAGVSKAGEPHADAPRMQSVKPQAQKTSQPFQPAQAMRGKHVRVEDASTKKAPRKGFTKSKKILLGVGIAVLAIAIAIVIFMLNAHDDAQDIQGTWQIQGSNATITITDKQIVLTDDVAYDYQMDPWAHTLDLGFFGASGTAQYTFNPDRNELVITENFVNDEGETVENTLTLVKPGTEADNGGGSDDAAQA